MFARIFLFILALIWIPSGLLCFVNPGSIANTFHVASTTAAGMTELRALYGGMGIALGIQALIAALRPATVMHALITQAVLNVGLVIARFLGAFLFDGFPTETLMILPFEGITAALAVFLAVRTRRIAESAVLATG